MIKKIKYEVDLNGLITTTCEIMKIGLGSVSCQEDCMHHIDIDKLSKIVTCGFIKRKVIIHNTDPSPGFSCRCSSYPEIMNENTNF